MPALLETYRLKNIAILILLLLNAFLLLLLGYQFLQSRQTASDTVEQLRSLYSGSQLDLDGSVDVLQEGLSPLRLSRNTTVEAAMAGALLGGEAESVSQGGGIYSYVAPAGELQFRSGGSFDGAGLRLPVDDPAAFCRSFCEEFSYQDLSLSLHQGTGNATATQYVAGVPIRGCGVTLTFLDGCLTAVSGSHVSPESGQLEDSEQLTCASALVRFLDYRSSAGIICSRVTAVSCVYSLQGTSSSLRLAPLWLIETDIYAYLVDASSGEISRA